MTDKGTDKCARLASIFVLTALAGLASVAGCGPSEPPKSSPESMREAHDPKLLFERGRDYAKSGDLSRAQEYLVGALDQGYQPRKDVLVLLLRVCVAAGNLRAGAEYGDRVLQQTPYDVHLRFVVASLYQSTGDIATAQKYLEECANRHPKDAEVQFALAVLLRDDVKDIVRADKYFRAYVALDPDGEHVDEARESMMQEVPRDANGVPTPMATPVPTPTASPAPAAPSGPPSPSGPASTAKPAVTPPKSNTGDTKPPPRQI